MKRRIAGISVAVSCAVLALSACETAPQDNALLAQARDAVSRAETNPDVTKFAPTDLDRARKLLVNAEGSAKERGADDKVATHYAYLAMQVARTAEQRAQEQVATARVKAGETERQKILLTARESEAERALAQARDARAQAMQARNEAQNAQAQVAQSQSESQRLAQELKAAQTERGLVLTLDDVLFDTGKAQLKGGASGRSTRLPLVSPKTPSGACRSRVSRTARAARHTTASCPRVVPTPWRRPSSSAASTRNESARWGMARSSR